MNVGVKNTRVDTTERYNRTVLTTKCEHTNTYIHNNKNKNDQDKQKTKIT